MVARCGVSVGRRYLVLSVKTDYGANAPSVVCTDMSSLQRSRLRLAEYSLDFSPTMAVESSSYVMNMAVRRLPDATAAHAWCRDLSNDIGLPSKSLGADGQPPPPSSAKNKGGEAVEGATFMILQFLDLYKGTVSRQMWQLREPAGGGKFFGFSSAVKVGGTTTDRKDVCVARCVLVCPAGAYLVSVAAKDDMTVIAASEATSGLSLEVSFSREHMHRNLRPKGFVKRLMAFISENRCIRLHTCAAAPSLPTY